MQDPKKLLVIVLAHQTNPRNVERHCTYVWSRLGDSGEIQRALTYLGVRNGGARPAWYRPPVYHQYRLCCYLHAIAVFRRHRSPQSPASVSCPAGTDRPGAARRSGSPPGQRRQDDSPHCSSRSRRRWPSACPQRGSVLVGAIESATERPDCSRQLGLRHRRVGAGAIDPKGMGSPSRN